MNRKKVFAEPGQSTPGRGHKFKDPQGRAGKGKEDVTAMKVRQSGRQSWRKAQASPLKTEGYVGKRVMGWDLRL